MVLAHQQKDNASPDPHTHNYDEIVGFFSSDAQNPQSLEVDIEFYIDKSLQHPGHGPLLNDLAVKVPRYENGFLYPPHNPGLGVELNEAVLPKLMTIGKSPTVIGK